MTNTLETLTKGLTDETFAEGDRKRLARLSDYFKSSKFEELAPETIKAKLMELSSSIGDLSEHLLRSRARYYYFLRKYSEPIPETKAELYAQDSIFQDSVRRNIGETGILLYRNRSLTKPEFAEALRKDLNFVDENANSENEETRLQAGRYLASVLEFAESIGFSELYKQLGEKYKDLFAYWMESDYY